MTPEDAMAYLGISDRDELEDLVLAHGVEADVDEDGQLEWLNPADLKPVLFAEHESKVGYHPEDPVRHQQAREVAIEKHRRAMARRDERRALLEQRIKTRGKPEHVPHKLSPAEAEALAPKTKKVQRGRDVIEVPVDEEVL
jgi:hypothetical protein